MSEIYFSQIREDSRIERYITEKEKPSNLVVIGSGGCTAFSVLNEEVVTVFCVDQNPAQCALIELKKAAMKALEREDFLAFIGEKPSDTRLEIYNGVSTQLPEYVKQFWDLHQDGIEIGINQCGVSERFYRFIGQNILHQVYGNDVWQQLFSCQSIEEQKEIFQRYFTSQSWKTAVSILLSKTTHLQFFPSFMFSQAEEHDFGHFFLHQFQKEITTKPIANQYFLSQFLFSTYLYDQQEGMPFYLSEEGYEKCRKQLDKLKIIPNTLQDFLNESYSIDAYYLSNVFDWADEKVREQICNGILKSKAQQAILFFRNMLSVPRLPSFFLGRKRIDQEWSDQCLDLERSMMYQKCTVSRIV